MQSGARSKELKAKREKNLMEYIDLTVSNLRHEIMAEIDQERSRKNLRLQEITNLIQHHKQLTDEHIQHQGESLRALLKAKLNQEILQIRIEFENVTKAINQRIDDLETGLDSRIALNFEKGNIRIDGV